MATLSYLNCNHSSAGIVSISHATQIHELDVRTCRSLVASTSGNAMKISSMAATLTKCPTEYRNGKKYQRGRIIQPKLDGIIDPLYWRLQAARSEMETGGPQRSSTASGDSPCVERDPNLNVSRRSMVSSLILCAASFASLREKSATLAAPVAAPLDTVDYREYVDRLDGYIFSYPSGWIQVKGAGADVFFRDPVNLDESVVVDFSSPSSSRYKSVKDLGTPQQAAERVLKQKITEFMSTRLGVRRESKIVSAKSRVGVDGRLYYDIEVDVKSYANTNQLAVMPADRVVKLEWSRRYLSTLGVENNRLYELKLQAPERVLANEGTGLRQIMSTFQLVKLEA